MLVDYLQVGVGVDFCAAELFPFHAFATGDEGCCLLVVGSMLFVLLYYHPWLHFVPC